MKTVDLGKAAVTKAKLAKNSVNSAKIADGSIANADIAAGAAIAATKINRTGLNADLLDGLHASALVKNNTATTQTLAGNLRAPDFAYSPAKTGVLTIPAVSANVVGSYGRLYGAAVYADTTAAVDWYAPVNLPDGATITGLTHSTVDVTGNQSSAQLVNWDVLVASVNSTADAFGWHADSTSTITAGQETFNDSGSYLVHVNMAGGNGTTLQSGVVQIHYTYTSPGN